MISQEFILFSFDLWSFSGVVVLTPNDNPALISNGKHSTNIEADGMLAYPRYVWLRYLYIPKLW